MLWSVAQRPSEDESSVVTPRGQEARIRWSEFSEGPREWLGDSEILTYEEMLSKLWFLSSKRKGSGGLVDLINACKYLLGAGEEKWHSQSPIGAQ